MHATNLAKIGIKYLSDLQLDDFCQLRDELDKLWKNGQSTISNNLYDKIIDSINYELTQLKNEPYDFAVRKTDNELKKVVDYLTQLHSQGQPLVENSI
jgi:glutathionyl-hydroquinone reductase